MCNPGNADRGSVLFVAMVAVLVVAALVASLLRSTSAAGHATLVSTDSEMALQIADAGIDAALNEMNWGHDYTSDGIGNESGNIGGGTYVVSISPPFEGVGTYNLRSTGTYQGTKRGVQAVVASTSAGGVFVEALFGRIGISGSGSCFTDGYDPNKGSYASQAVNTYRSVRYADSQGSIGSNGGILLSSGTIFGNATPGPGSNVILSGSAYVQGSTAPAAKSTVLAPVIYAPTVAASGAYNNGGTTQTMRGGTYRFATWTESGSAVVEFTGNTTLYVDGNFTVSGSAIIKIDPGASVTVCHGSGNFTLSGGGLLNTTLLAKNFQVYSAASGSGTVTLSGGSGFYGTIYAPEATLVPSGNAGFWLIRFWDGKGW